MEDMRDFVAVARASDKEALIQNYGLQRVLNRALERRIDELSQQNELLKKQLEVLTKENKFLKADYFEIIKDYGQFKAQHGFLPEIDEDDL